MSAGFLTVTCHEIAINYESELKTQSVLLDIPQTITLDCRRPFSSKLFLFLKHNIIFAKFLEIILDVTSSHTRIFDKPKIILASFELKFPNILLKALYHQNDFKNAL